MIYSDILAKAVSPSLNTEIVDLLCPLKFHFQDDMEWYGYYGMTRRECNGTRFLGDHVGPGAASWTIQCREAGVVHGGSWAEIGNNIRSFEVCKTTWSKWLLDATCGVHGALSEVIPHEPIYLFSFECTGLKDNNLMRAAYICILWQTRDPQSHRYQNPRRPQRSKGIPSGKNTRHSPHPSFSTFHSGV